MAKRASNHRTNHVNGNGKVMTTLLRKGSRLRVGTSQGTFFIEVLDPGNGEITIRERKERFVRPQDAWLQEAFLSRGGRLEYIVPDGWRSYRIRSVKVIQ